MMIFILLVRHYCHLSCLVLVHALITGYTNHWLLSLVTTSACGVEQKAMRAERRSCQCQIKHPRKPIEQYRLLSSDSLKNGTCNPVQQQQGLCPQSQVLRRGSYLESAAPLQSRFCIPVKNSHLLGLSQEQAGSQKFKRCHFLVKKKKTFVFKWAIKAVSCLLHLESYHCREDAGEALWPHRQRRWRVTLGQPGGSAPWVTFSAQMLQWATNLRPWYWMRWKFQRKHRCLHLSLF